jgi:hypothetical protein
MQAGSGFSTTGDTEGTESGKERDYQSEPFLPSASSVSSVSSVSSDLKTPRSAKQGEVAERSEAGEGLPRFMPEGFGPSVRRRNCSENLGLVQTFPLACAPCWIPCLK